LCLFHPLKPHDGLLMPTPALLPGQAFQVFSADDLFVSNGVNQGDALDAPDLLCLGDAYSLAPAAQPIRLALASATHANTLAPGTEAGTAGDPVRLEARYTLMDPDGSKLELMVLMAGRARFALPLSPMARRVAYTLLEIDTAPQSARLSDLLNISFASGTLITLPSGRAVEIDRLQPGDMVLTRDHGPQPIAWVGRATLRAVGAFAPVVIPAGSMGNSGDLIVSQHHRMFLYQRKRLPGLATSELLVQAKHLVDEDTIFIREGGMVDYFSLIFDAHEIIYAEGIPAESLMVTEATLHRLPPELSEQVKAQFPGLSHHQHFGTEAGRDALTALRNQA
jgi:Hint domain